MVIDVYADVVCPWCYIGEQRLERAMAPRPDVAIERRWHPFQLQPTMPPQGILWGEFAPRTFGGAENARRMFDRVAAVGAEDGITFNFDTVVSAPNTVDAHRLIAFARNHNREWEMVNGLFVAYFAEGRDLNDLHQLEAIAAGVGLPQGEVRAYLASQEGVAEVQASQAEAGQLGVRGVPFYVVNDQYALSGAQPIELFLQAIDAVSNMRPINQSTITLDVE